MACFSTRVRFRRGNDDSTENGDWWRYWPPFSWSAPQDTTLGAAPICAISLPFWQVLQGQWLLPSALIDGTVPAAGPLYYWVAALLGLLLEPLGLALHDATRFASPLLLLCTLLSLGAAALPWCGKPWQAGAMLVGLGTLGWVLDAHQHQALLASAPRSALPLPP